ncbi:hypothetical protein C4M97_01230 [Mycoplasmopsis pullorum]|uniref:Ig-specific serine endopeptidase MIP n=1 Tax=Mycoplasmopsis pullorum TaxID=48003 RepID=UPI001118C0F0|nr:DUF31 family protein [Mycoplasmopsis pullorum]TNK83077.1 hypothetical protein C4M80_01445 [Mycoplasmopsis pullorum]TNK85008.1 hypothetical protein C4M81_00585 [Mycoplasmopsis pullorum]TNK85605.1 hypothetical protein C4M92_00810 [Mycoplasmopsis pullorum]TNK86385.1 hypothetical protein C4M85_00265 [Mycoplasmopsis pullorum]TNK87217.1 hypothetical protein C4M82_00190 [Mycoplasmopsis pullorum]
MKRNKKKLLFFSTLTAIAGVSLSGSCTVNVHINEQNKNFKNQNVLNEFKNNKDRLIEELKEKTELTEDEKNTFVHQIEAANTRGALEEAVKNIKEELLKIRIRQRTIELLEKHKDVVRKLINESEALSAELKAELHEKLNSLTNKDDIKRYLLEVQQKIEDEKIRAEVLEYLNILNIDAELAKYEKDLGQYKEYELRYSTELLYKLKEEDKADTIINNYKNVNKDVVDKFNTISAANYQIFYQDAYIKNFSLPNANKDLVLNPNKIKPVRKYYDSKSGDRGKPRFLMNEHYKRMALDTYRIVFNNENPEIAKDPDTKSVKSGKQSWGTAWILDYEIPEDGSYPTKWYIATNLHVVMPFHKNNTDRDSDELYVNNARIREEHDLLRDALLEFNALEAEFNEAKVRADQIKASRGEDDPEYKAFYSKYQDIANPSEWLINYNTAFRKKEKYENFIGITTGISLYNFSSDVPLNIELDTVDKDPYVQQVDLEPAQVKIVYAALDFLKQSPKSYLDPNSKHKNIEEFADFAVLEVDFGKLASNKLKYTKKAEGVSGGENFVESSSELARVITNNYADLPESEKAKPANYDVLSKYHEWETEVIEYTDGNQKVPIPRINANFLALGYPSAETDYSINNAALSDDRKFALKYTASLWTNKPNTQGDGIRDFGHSLSKNLAYRNFVDKPGVTDMTITNPIYVSTKDEPFNVEGFRDKSSSYQGDGFMNYGLGYVLTTWQPLGGSSGSSIRDLNNNILAVNYLTTDNLGNTLVNLSQALRSPGYDYDGQYGKYKLESYDLVYGGGKNQRTSFRQSLLKLYGGQFKTRLFPEGVSKIPAEYRFNLTEE